MIITSVSSLAVALLGSSPKDAASLSLNCACPRLGLGLGLGLGLRLGLGLGLAAPVQGEVRTRGSRSKSKSCLGPSARLGFEPRAAYDALRPHGAVEVAHVVLVLIAHVEHHRSGLGRVLGSGEHLSPRLGLQVLACLG